MAAIPQPERGTAQAVYALHAQRVAAQAPRDYLGWSELGAECDRALWYGFRQAGRKPFEGRMARLFDTGHREEARVLQELRDLGLTVWDRDVDGGQFAVSSIGGHLRGHIDAVVLGLVEAPATPHLFDVKTIKAKKFDELLKKGIRALYPKYWAQGQGYMGHLSLERAAFMFVCKDDDRIHLERFSFDQAEFDKYEARGARLIAATAPPPRLSEDPAWFECKFCDFHEICHGTKVAAVSCRSCAHATPLTEGDDAIWCCDAAAGDVIPAGVLRTGCEGHRLIPLLLERLGKPVDSDGDAVTYQAANGRQFVNGPAPGFSSVEIALADGVEALTDETVQALKSGFTTARLVA